MGTASFLRAKRARSNRIIATGRYTAFDILFTVEEERAYIEQMSARDIFHVAVNQSDGTIVGFQSLSPFANYTQTFDHVGTLGTFVDMRYQRQGIRAATLCRHVHRSPRPGL